MHKRMGTAIVLMVLLAASFAFIAFDNSDESDAATVGELPVYEDADVTPFTFPESKGKPVMKALIDATSKIDISIYYLTSKDIMAILCEKQAANVDVRVLIEGTPLTVSTNVEMQMLMKLDNLGADVRVINAKNNDSVYPYVHNKYAIIDGDTVVVTSENWTASNIGNGGNRGWGAIIENGDYANHMKEVFESDFDLNRTGVDCIETIYPDLSEYSDTLTYNLGSYTAPPTYYGVSISPVQSPDKSFDSLKNFIGMAESRVYVEQMDISKEYASLTNDTPLAWMNEKAEAGLDVKFVLNTSYESDGTGEHHSLIDTLNSTTHIKAAGISGGKGFTVTHNKGIIVDNMVWLGSVNWTSTSMTQNREVAVIVYSSEVTEYFNTYFGTDFENNYSYGNINITFYVDEHTKYLSKYYAGDVIHEPDIIPTKAYDAVYKYTFSHWEGFTTGMVASEDTVFTAVFTQSEYDAVSIRFVADSQEIIIYLEENDTIVAPDIIPEKESDGKYNYMFSHWEGYSEGMAASADTTFSAVFLKEAIPSSEDEEELPWYYALIIAAIIILGLILKLTGKGGKKRRHSYPKSSGSKKSSSKKSASSKKSGSRKR